MELKQPSNAPMEENVELKDDEANAPVADDFEKLTDFVNNQNEIEPLKEPESSDEEQEEESEHQPEEVDYKELLEKLTKERDNYKEGLLSLKKRIKEGGNDVDVSDLVEEKLNEFKKEITKTTFEELLEKTSDDEDERALILYHYENSIKQTGFDKKSIASDLETAQLLANRKKIEKENNEMKLSLKNKSQITNSGVGSNRAEKSLPAIRLTTAEQSLLDRTNVLREKRGLKPLTAREFIQN